MEHFHRALRDTLVNDGYDSHRSIQIIGLIVTGVTFVVILFGLVGNILSMVVWSRPHLKSSSSVVLTTLAVCDTLVVLSGLWQDIPVFHQSLSGYKSIYPNFYSTIDNFIYYNYYTLWTRYIVSMVIYKMAVTASMYLTVIITVERYICICHPFRFEEWCPYSRTCKFVALTLIFSVLYHVSGFWVLRLEEFPYFTDGKIITLYVPERTELHGNPYLGLIRNFWVKSFVDYLLPLSCIIILNIITYIKLRRINTKRRAISDQQNNDNKLTKMVIYIVVEFLVCTALRWVTYLMPSTSTYTFDQHCLLMQSRSFFNLVNSSVNFVTYFSSWPPFRRTFIKMFGCHKKRDQPPPDCPENPNHTPNQRKTSIK